MSEKKPIFKKNETKKTNYNVLRNIVLMSDAFEPLGVTERKTQIMSSNVAMSVKGLVDANDYNEDTLKQIYNLQLPSYMSWDYWVFLNQWVDYWVNRYKITCQDKDNKHILTIIRNALRNAVMFGSGAIDKDGEEILGGGVIDRTLDWNGLTVGGKLTPCYLALSSGSVATFNKNGVSFSKEIQMKAKELSESACILDWRYNRIGDFVWCMKDLLIDMFFKKMIETNNSNLLNKLGITVKNPDTLPIELSILRNPFLSFFIKVSDEQSESKGENKFETFNNGDKGGSHINSLVECLKHHQEYYYAKYGRPISSNKQQSLSSDASLSVMSQEAIAREHDERVKHWIEEIKTKLNINIMLELDEPDMQPDNENADKEGEGVEKTEGAINNEKVERMEQQ